MISRRGVLGLFGKAAVAGTWFHMTGATSLMHAQTMMTPLAPVRTSSTFDATLQANMTKLASRVYSEEGIPMILACKDLTAKKPVVPARKATNAAVATAIARYVESWGHQHPDAPAGDVAKLVELLSFLDFESGGKDNNL